MPQTFALKEVDASNLFPLGQNKDIRDYLPLNEAAIQLILRHRSIVETYWADVRCLDPNTNQPLDIGVEALQRWTSLDDIDGLNKSVSTAHHGAVQSLKLQMRIAMEHCDLGAALPSFQSRTRNAGCSPIRLQPRQCVERRQLEGVA